MRSHVVGLIASLAVIAGCAHVGGRDAPCLPTFSRYRAAHFDWNSVRRILLMPLDNESAEPRAADEIRNALAAVLQSTGRFEAVIAPLEARLACSEAVRVGGRFDEAEMLEIAVQHQADAILCGAVTQHRSYAPPRIGLSLRLVSTAEATVIASVDGLWDAGDEAIAEQARCYHDQTATETPSLLGSEIILASPHLYRRFVCHAAVQALVR